MQGSHRPERGRSAAQDPSGIRRSARQSQCGEQKPSGPVAPENSHGAAQHPAQSNHHPSYIRSPALAPFLMTPSSSQSIANSSRAQSSSSAQTNTPFITHPTIDPSPLRATMDSPQYKPDTGLAAPGNSTNGKDSASPHRGFQPRNGGENGIIKVQPPRREDLQPSYAQMLQGETEADAHGWYGSMSTFAPTPLTALALTPPQSTAWVPASVSSVPFPAVLSVPTPTSPSPRVMSASSPSLASEYLRARRIPALY